MDLALNNGFCEMTMDEITLTDGGTDLDTIGIGFTTVCGTIGTVCLLTGGAAATAAVTTIAAPVVLIGVSGAVLGGVIIGRGINK